MDEKFEKAVKDCIIPILSRFTNGITDLKVEVNKDFHGREYYSVETNDILMTPCVFKSLCIQGTGRRNKDENGNKNTAWTLHWHWESFDGGTNGAKLVSILMRESPHTETWYVEQTYIR